MSSSCHVLLIVLHRQPIAYTSKIHGKSHRLQRSRFSGIAGLSSCNTTDSTPGGLSSFMESLSAKGHVESPGFSLWMNPTNSIGELILGAIDESKYSSPLYLFDLVNPQTSYSINLEKISTSSGSTSSPSQIATTFDTTTDAIVLPRSWEVVVTDIFTGTIENSSLFEDCSLASARLFNLWWAMVW
jgi:Eukaryotic aspartyl protease